MRMLIDKNLKSNYNQLPQRPEQELRGMVAMTISTIAIYEDGVLRLLEKLQLPEQEVLSVTIRPFDEHAQQTLADVLGFDPSDEEKLQELAESQHLAFTELVANLADAPGSPPPHDSAVNHDKYIYGIDWQ